MKKTDGNHKAVLRALRQIPGISVLDLSGVGQGCPDLLVGYKGKNYLFEIKNAVAGGKLNLRQQQFFEEWRGHRAIVRELDEILSEFGFTPF